METWTVTKKGYTQEELICLSFNFVRNPFISLNSKVLSEIREDFPLKNTNILDIAETLRNH